MLGHAKIDELYFEDEHFSRNCGCMIPAGWVAIVRADTGQGYKRIPNVSGDYPPDIVNTLKSEYSSVTMSKLAHWGWDNHQER